MFLFELLVFYRSSAWKLIRIYIFKFEYSELPLTQFLNGKQIVDKMEVSVVIN